MKVISNIMNIKISANLGFLWNELPLKEAINNAARVGFDAVECHWPYEVAKDKLSAYLLHSKLKMISINTPKGDMKGDFGLNALPGRESEAKRNIELSLNYAKAIGACYVHVMAGISSHLKARDTFLSNLEFAIGIAKKRSLRLLIEPMSSSVVPGYFLTCLSKAISILRDLDDETVKVMFDAYHLYDRNVSIVSLFQKNANFIGHIQFSSIPNRQAPHSGSVDYISLIKKINNAGYNGYFGAEYRPGTEIDSEMVWLKNFRNHWEKED